MSCNSRKWLIPSAIAVWCCVTVLAFWRFEFVYLFPVSRPVGAETVNAATLPRPSVSILNTSSGPLSIAHPDSPILINFWNPQCACSAYMEHHVRQLMRLNARNGVKFVTVIVDPNDGFGENASVEKWLGRGFSASNMPWVFDKGNIISKKLGVWAAPAAVIIDTQGRVVYIGAYNVSRFCDSDETAFAQIALNDTIAGHQPKIRSLPFYGCQITAHP